MATSPNVRKGILPIVAHVESLTSIYNTQSFDCHDIVKLQI